MIGEPAPQSPYIRKYRTEDRDSIREICWQTAYQHAGGMAFFEDRELFADYWTLYYTDVTPETVWVLIEAETVVGYLLGCRNTRHFLRVMAWNIAPVILLTALWRWSLGKYRNKRSHRFLKWLLMKSWREAPFFPVKDYPARFHFNLLPVVRHNRKYHAKRLILTFLDDLDSKNIRGLHIQTLEAEAKGLLKILRNENMRLQANWLGYYFEKPTAFYRDVLGLEIKMVNRVAGLTVAAFRNYLSKSALNIGLER